MGRQHGACPRPPHPEGSSSQDAAELQRAGTFRVAVLVGREGQVLRAEVRQSSGNRLQDDMALQAAQFGQYLPELVDGVSVAAWYEVCSRR